jgi:hypothetical protein
MNLTFWVLELTVLILVSLHFRVGEKLSELLEEFQLSNAISVIATAPSILKVSSSLVAPLGRHIFKTVLEIPELNKVISYIILFNAKIYFTEVICNTVMQFLCQT